MMTILLLSLLTAHLGMLLSFFIYQRIKKEVLADIAWAIGIALQGSLYFMFFEHSLEKVWLLSLLWLWSLRLAGFLYWNRIRLPWQDKRYEKIIENSKYPTAKTIGMNYQIQAFLQWIMGLAWFFVMQNPSIQSYMLVMTSMLFILGLGIETLADEQLKKFKKHPVGPVCQQGLWRYSRHPNYLGEILIWISFALNSDSLLAIVSPLGLYLIMRFITGPLTEQASMEHKGKSYLDYQQSTPMIFPYKLFCSKRFK